jgi:hypothetical protein
MPPPDCGFTQRPKTRLIATRAECEAAHKHLQQAMQRFLAAKEALREAERQDAEEAM